MSSHRKEFSNLEKQYQSLKKDCENLQDEVEIANLDPKEAHAKFKSRVEQFKIGAKSQEEQANQLKIDIQAARKTLEELESSNEVIYI
jgi:predicted  nucleic acid-binding Zn-ribbon protein